MKSSGLFASVLVAVCAFAAVCEAQSQGHALAALERDFPGVRVRESGGRTRQIYGVHMTRGESAREAAQAWLSEYAPAFTGSELELEEHSQIRLKTGKTVVTYRQTLGGLEVENGVVTVVVHDKPAPTVNYVSARAADAPGEPWGNPAIPANTALSIAQASAVGKG